MKLENAYYIIGTAYAGKSTLVKRLAEKYRGIACEENYHDAYLTNLDKGEYPNLTYTRDLADWHDFIRRTPEQYAAWVAGSSKECERLELQILRDLNPEGKLVFVDTNISIETLRQITVPHHVLVMLADPEVSVRRFFERPDKEKQFLYRLMLEEPDPEASLANFRACLKRINTQEAYDTLLHSGFPVILRDENRTVEETMAMAERCFGLSG